MKRTLFILTHVASGWEKLAEALERDQRVQVFNTGGGYHHPDDVHDLTDRIHRRNNSAAVWADVIQFNKDFTLKRLMQHYRIVVWTKEFEQCRDDLLRLGYGSEQAEHYYAYRLDGIKQYWMRRQTSLWNPDLEREDLLDAILG